MSVAKHRLNSVRDSHCRAWAPASVGNTAVGFDTLGFALRGPGDVVTARRAGVTGGTARAVITKITGLSEGLPFSAQKNTAAVAAAALLAAHGGGLRVALEIHKGIPSSGGMGGSAASAVAAVLAVNRLLRKPLPRPALLEFALAGEAAASGSRHADNVAPSLLGGLQLTVTLDPPLVVRVAVPEKILCVMVKPALQIATRRARALLRPEVTLAAHIEQSARLAGFIRGCMANDLTLMRATLEDRLIEPQRASLIPGFYEAKQAALDGGAIGFSIAGAGPSVFAWVASRASADRVWRTVMDVFKQRGLQPEGWILPIDQRGARVVP
jgi:homoserine kinase